MPATYTYSFKSTHCSIQGPGGSIALGDGSGAAEEGISFEPSEDRNQMTIGADGSSMHSLRADQSARVTVRLLKTSPQNAVLQAMANFQWASATNHGQNTLSLATQAGDAIVCQQVAFARQTPLSYGKDAGMNEWLFDAGMMNTALGAGVA